MSGSARARRRRARIGTVVSVAVLAVGVEAALGSPTNITRAGAHAVAVAINLRDSDLPKLSAQSNPITAQQRRFSAQLPACLHGVSNSAAYAEAGKDWTHGVVAMVVKADPARTEEK